MTGFGYTGLMADELDVIVLGLGVGGEEVGGKLADAGLSVLGIENRLVGGECPYWGCIPSKMMIRASGLLTEPSGMARTADGALLVVSLGGKTIEAFAVDTGEHLGTRVGLAGGLQAPTHMLVRPAG